MTPTHSNEVVRTTLGVLFIGLMIGSSLWVLKPFIGATIWATMIVVATWPLMTAVQTRLGGRRWAAVTVMTTAMLLLIIIPLIGAVTAVVDNAESIFGWIRTMATAHLPPPPAWVQGIPLIGGKVAAEWQRIADADAEQLAAQASPYVRTAISWLAVKSGGFGLTLLNFLLVVAVTAVLYAQGEDAARGVRRFARRLAGDRGENSVILAGQAIRAVALGVVVTALVQSGIGGIGLAVTGVPFAVPLTAIMLLLCIAQLGPLLVLGPAVAWLFWQDHNAAGTVLLVWSAVVGTLDNFLRPWLIKRGADLPLLLILVGVIGGLVAFGIIGLFVGPVVLAVSYTLLTAWVADIDAAPPLSGATYDEAPKD